VNQAGSSYARVDGVEALNARAPSRSRKPLRLAHNSLRLASRLAVGSMAAA